MDFITKQLAKQPFCKDFYHIFIPVIGITGCQTERQYLFFIVHGQVKLEFIELPGGAFSSLGKILEYFM
jgi:hypothetical protein